MPRNLFSSKQTALLIMGAIILLGLTFRLANLGNKIFWVDEVATVIRVVGYTRSEIIALLTDAPNLTIATLQQYLQLTPDRSWLDTFKALTQSPEHAPLYFLIARAWAGIFGSSILALRSLSVIFSLIALPCLYALCEELFQSAKTGSLAVIFLSLSPFYIAYAQEARPYSLWAIALLLCSLTLLQARRFNQSRHWWFYTATLVFALYTSLLSGLVILGQAVYIAVLEKLRITSVVKAYLRSVSVSLIFFSPWLWVIAQHWGQLQANTTWMQSPLSVWTMAIAWAYSIVIVFVDLPVSLSLPPLIFARGVVIIICLLVLAIAALYFIYKKTPRSTWLLVITLTFSTLLPLVAADLILGRQASAAPRYMIPAHLGLVMAIAHLISYHLPNLQNFPKTLKISIRQFPLWTLILLSLITMGLLSDIANWNSSPKYQKTRNLYNPSIAALINQMSFPTVLAEPDESLDLLSMTQFLKPTVKIQIHPSDRLERAIPTGEICFLFNPSQTFLEQLQQSNRYQLSLSYKPELLFPGELHLALWSIQHKSSVKMQQ